MRNPVYWEVRYGHRAHDSIDGVLKEFPLSRNWISYHDTGGYKASLEPLITLWLNMFLLHMSGSLFCFSVTGPLTKDQADVSCMSLDF